MKKIDKAIEILQAFKEGKTIMRSCLEGTSTFLSSKILDEDVILEWLSKEPNSLYIKKEPTYRPYANAEECIKASKEHGPYIKFSDNLYHVPTINKLGKSEPWRIYVDTPAYNGLSFEEILKFTWSDGTPCGILEQ